MPSNQDINAYILRQQLGSGLSRVAMQELDQKLELLPWRPA